MKFDLVIHNAVIVTVNPDFDIIKNGVIGIRWIIKSLVLTIRKL
jgi:hypothetical protein